MNKKLSILDTIKKSFLEIKENPMFWLQILIFLGIYHLFQSGISRGVNFLSSKENINIMATIGTSIIVVGRYFLYFIIIRLYFYKVPIFEIDAIKRTLVKSLAIFIITTAGFGAMFAIYKIIALLRQYAYIPEFMQDIPYKLINLTIYAITSFITILIIIVPSFAWVSSVIGNNDSITKAFLTIKGNYIRLILIILALHISFIAIDEVFILVFQNTPDILYRFLRQLLIVFELIFKFSIYINIYEFFYSKEKTGITK